MGPCCSQPPGDGGILSEEWEGEGEGKGGGGRRIYETFSGGEGGEGGDQRKS